MATIKLLFAFLGTGAISFILFYFMLKQSNKESVAIIETKDKAGMKRLKKEFKQERWTVQNVLMSKWVAFGGGFYGVMAVLTYVIVEFFEIVDFLSSESSFVDTISSLGFSDLISFFINSLMNFVTAITWPIYWMKNTDGYAIWVWFVTVYLGYTCGQYLAKNSVNPYEG
ncbi:hypothetical protein [Marinicella litoralis]|uniref:Uncharacterized protein n=1 Tax=Marinicella litoralis TaxID=644220 RepID=A0A4R6XJB3_9GAMM|nr:hypothetical protein [Marinicella litoralis]TDR17507.1 hypothetical protein C8D91_2566 [Marinicella litoralis]